MFPCEASDDSWSCRRAGPEVITASLKSVNPLIEYLGRWLKEGDYDGSLSISVWRPKGSPEESRTRSGPHDGFTVDWARGPDVLERSAVALTGHGTRLFPPLSEGQPEAYEQRGNTAVLIGKSGDRATALLSHSRSYSPFAIFIHVVSYADVDAAIAEWAAAFAKASTRAPS
ncbi:hypothetical protein [Myxococcus sp. Y35]|uniref:hypothetical protein n=1 Tax=Pseudomyxococcus flavus TaxID=3115648 RepID=UPI003CE814D5